MRIVAAFLLLIVFSTLVMFLTFTSSWGSLLMPHVAANDPGAVVEELAPSPEWQGKYVVAVSQPVVLRSAPLPSAQTMSILHKGQQVLLRGCDVSGIWCQTEAGAWLVSYGVGALPDGLPTLQDAAVQAAPTPLPTLDLAQIAPAPTQVPAILLLPTPTPVPTTLPQGRVADAANLRAGPGTAYAIAGSAALGESLSLAGQSADGEWYQIDSGAWIAAFLLRERLASLPIVDAPASPRVVGDGQAVEPGTEPDGASVLANP